MLNMFRSRFNETDDQDNSFRTAVENSIKSTEVTDLVMHPRSRDAREEAPTSPTLPIRSENESHTTTHNNSGLTLSDQGILEPEGFGIDLKSLIKEVDELCNRPRKGEVYESIYVNQSDIVNRLKFLSQNPGKLSIDEAIEIYDVSVLLKLPTQYFDVCFFDLKTIQTDIDVDNSEAFKRYKELVHLAGQKAHSGVQLMLQAKMIEAKGRELLAQSKSNLQMAYFKSADELPKSSSDATVEL